MKKNVLMSLLVMMAMMLPAVAHARLSITARVKSPGRLISELESDMRGEIEEIRITGRINAKDLEYLRTFIVRPKAKDGEDAVAFGPKRVRKVDLRDAVIVRSTGDRISTGDNMIPKGVFNSCRGLQEVVLPENLVKIGDNAFYKCKGLSHIDFPATINSIGSSAFAECDSLRTVQLPGGMDRVAANAFNKCSRLQLLAIDGDIDVIGSSAFSETGLKSVSIDGMVEHLGSFAFSSCHKLTELNITGDVQQVDECAFCNTGLSEVTLHGIQGLGTSVFRGNSNLRVVNLDGSYDFSTIPEGTFYDCVSLTDVNWPGFPSDIKVLGTYCFRNCKSLKPFELPDGLVEIGDEALMGIPYTTVTIPASVNSLGESVFKNSISLTSADLQCRVSEIKKSTFEGCTGLTSITLPATVVTIGDYAFKKCTALTDVALPENLSQIGNEAFTDCISLQEIDLPDRVTSLGEWAFADDPLLRTVHMPAALTKLGKSAFENCPSLTEIIIPNAVQNIEKHTFKNCSSLSKVTVGTALQQISAYSFENCTALTSFTCMAVQPPKLDKNAFKKASGVIRLEVPAASVEQYQKAKNWDKMQQISAIGQ